MLVLVVLDGLAAVDPGQFALILKVEALAVKQTGQFLEELVL